MAVSRVYPLQTDTARTMINATQIQDSFPRANQEEEGKFFRARQAPLSGPIPRKLLHGLGVQCHRSVKHGNRIVPL